MTRRERPRTRNRTATRILLGCASIATAVALLSSCSALRGSGDGQHADAMRRSALEYLAEGDPTVDRPQPLAVHAKLDPGDSTLVARATPTAPPQVSHELASLLPITLEENACFACHLPDAAGEDDIPIPDSHFARPNVEVALLRSDPRFAGRAMLSYVAGYNQQEEEPIGARYNCVQCHTASAQDPAGLGARP